MIGANNGALTVAEKDMFVTLSLVILIGFLLEIYLRVAESFMFRYFQICESALSVVDGTDFVNVAGERTSSFIELFELLFD